MSEKENDNASRFLDLYSYLEKLLRAEFSDIPAHEGALAWVARNKKQFKRMREELDYCRDVRNLLQHNRKINGVYAVSPSDAMIDTLQRTIEKVEKPKRARDICVRTNNILWAELPTKAMPVMQEMAKRAYTHVPLLNDGRVIGAFSENTLLTYLMDEEIVCIDEDVRFDDFGELLLLNNHESETFEFVGELTPASEIADLFEQSLKNQQRLGMVFVTANGKEAERLLGIITAWDMAVFL